MGGKFSSEPWRDVSKDYGENLRFLNSYKLQKQGVKHLRILLHGPVGAGKSSFINSVQSALNGRISGPAEPDKNSGGSVTKGEYKAYKILKADGSFCSFIFNDIMGLEEMTNKGVKVEDLKLALKGHVANGYTFNSVQLKANNKYYISSPTLEDKVHVLVSVIPADSVSRLGDVVKELREVRMAASEMGIPQLAILTKIDEACPEVEQNMDKVYAAYYLKRVVDQFSKLLGLSQNRIFLVRNYDKEDKTNEDMDALILSALKRMICFGDDFVNNQ